MLETILICLNPHLRSDVSKADQRPQHADDGAAVRLRNEPGSTEDDICDVRLALQVDRDWVLSFIQCTP